jgi:chromate transporter
MKALNIFWIFLKLGCTSFGGPVAHLAYFRQVFVEKRQWFSESQYLHLLSICQLIPGPASSQVGFAIGLLRGGWLGAICAFIAFTLPSVVLLIIFANSLYLLDSAIGHASLQGLAILAFIVVLQAVMGMGKQLLSSSFSWVLAAAVFVLVLLTNNILIQLISIAVCAGLSALRSSPQNNSAGKGNTLFSTSTHYLPGTKSALIAALCFVVLCLLFVSNPQWANQVSYDYASSFFFSGSTVFGGGHVVLPFLEQTTVAQNLISKEAFLAGYGATQAVPGPMFSFAAYLGYVIDINEQANVSAAIGSALLATLFLFIPGFLLVSALLPVSQKVFNYPRVKEAFTGANAAVIGLLAGTLYDPIFTHAINSNTDIAIAGVGFVALTRLKFPVLAIVFLCVLLKVLEALIIT